MSLLAKDVSFYIDDGCLKVWKRSKQELVSALIISTPNWTKPFEIMCDALNFVIRIVLGQCNNNRQHIIYYASRTLNDAQLNYTMTEKEFLAIVIALEKI